MGKNGTTFIVRHATAKAGDGQGLVSKRLPVQAPTFHSKYLYGQKLGHFYDVISNGVRSMPAYAHQIPEDDRWAIVAYVRALQLSQNPKAFDEPGDEEQANAVELSPAALKGKALYASKTCNACHSLDGSKLVGPSFKGFTAAKKRNSPMGKRSRQMTPTSKTPS